MKVFVLVQDYGDYESAGVQLLGVYSTEEGARAAMPRLRAIGEVRWQHYELHKATKDEYLTRCNPVKVFPPGGCFGAKEFRSYANEDYVAAEKYATENVGAVKTLITTEDRPPEVMQFELDNPESV